MITINRSHGWVLCLFGCWIVFCLFVLDIWISWISSTCRTTCLSPWETFESIDYHQSFLWMGCQFSFLSFLFFFSSDIWTCQFSVTCSKDGVISIGNTWHCRFPVTCIKDGVISIGTIGPIDYPQLVEQWGYEYWECLTLNWLSADHRMMGLSVSGTLCTVVYHGQ